MNAKIKVTSVSLLILLFLAGASGCIAATKKALDEGGVSFIAQDQDALRITVNELQFRLNDPALILIDVRSPGDWNISLTKIKGAFREVLAKIEEWASKYDKDKTIVLYCA